MTDHAKPEGAISAAIIAAGAGAAALGVITVVAAASVSANEWLAWNARVGPLAGKTTLATVIWLLCWAMLHLMLRNRPTETRTALTVALVLVAIGVVGTFPPFFQLFSH